MSTIPFISPEDVEQNLTWIDVVDALDNGHQKSRAEIADQLLKNGNNSMLNRAAWIPGLGLALKTVTIFPDNPERTPPLPSVNGAVILYNGDNGTISAIIDGILVTKWKTAGDSMLGARYLARPDSKNILIIGSGAVARSLVGAYNALYPNLDQISVWSRNPLNAEQFAHDIELSGYCVKPVSDLEHAVSHADIISTATLATSPILTGEWIQPGTHIDLIGAFRPDMREADDATLLKAKIFVDSRQTTIGHIGELIIPMSSGVISENDILADFYDLCNGAEGRTSDDDITVFKNGGGAHLDTMTAHLIWSKYASAHQTDV